MAPCVRIYFFGAGALVGVGPAGVSAGAPVGMVGGALGAVALWIVELSIFR
jgi:hypothetical protein